MPSPSRQISSLLNNRDLWIRGRRRDLTGGKRDSSWKENTVHGGVRDFCDSASRGFSLCMDLSVVWFVSHVVGLFSFRGRKETGSDANEFVNAKSNARKKLLLAG